VNKVIESNDELALSDIYAQPLRLVFHDAGEVNLANPHDSMGSDGCLSDAPDNKGLFEAESLVYSLLDPIWQDYCDSISRADFWVLIGKLAVEKAADDKINIPFQYGRKDNLECSAGRGRLPNAQQGFEGDNGIIQVFVNRMGLTLSDAGLIHLHTTQISNYILYVYYFSIVTLSGAHTLGHVHLKNSGYSTQEPPESKTVNAWDNSPAKFDSGYFKYLLEKVKQ
jgi:catalase (peroxidase I)